LPPAIRWLAGHRCSTRRTSSKTLSTQRITQPSLRQSRPEGWPTPCRVRGLLPCSHRPTQLSPPCLPGRGFGDSIALLARKPKLCEHATEAPTASDLPRPRELDIRIIARTGDPARPGGEAQTGCRGEHNIGGKRSKLHLESGHDVRKPSRASIVNGMKIIGQIHEELSAMGYSQPNSGIRAVDTP